MATSSLPSGLPEPIDDGAASHLRGMAVPDFPLAASSGDEVNLSRLSGRSVVYIYPMSGEDDDILPDNWDTIPGARGCTPQHCDMRDHHAALINLGARVFGVATQSPAYLHGEVERLHLPYVLLSDENLKLTTAARLPVLDTEVAGQSVLKRTTLIIRDGVVEQVFYPVFPPDEAAEQVIEWLHGASDSHVVRKEE